MSNVQVLRSVALLAVALLFGSQALRLNLGTPSNAGAGLFPLIVSGLLGLIAAVMLVQSRFERSEPADLNLRNIAVVFAGLAGFAFLAHWSVIPAIVFLVFVSSLAGSDYSIIRCLKISAALIAIAAGFRYGLGLNLQLY